MQNLKAEARFYHKLGLKSNWVSRIDIGIGLPYGNSVQLPYVKQFFVGGSNSLRGFRSRAVGPGIYVQQDSSNVIPDQTGDIKFEINTEFRPHISGPFMVLFFWKQVISGWSMIVHIHINQVHNSQVNG